MNMLLAFRGVHGGAANAARTAGIAAYFYNIAAVLVLIFLVIVFLAILGLCVELFRSWRTDPSEQGRQSGRILLIILVVLSGMSYVDYNYTNLLGGLCKEAVRGAKARGIRANRGNATNFGKYWVHGFPQVGYKFSIESRLRTLCAELETAKPADIPALQQRLGTIKNDLRTAYGKDRPLPKETEAFFKQLSKDIDGKYTPEEVQEAQVAWRRDWEARQAQQERIEKETALKEILLEQNERGTPFTREEVDDIVRLRGELGATEDAIQRDLDYLREKKLLPEGYQMPPKDVPPAAEAAPPAAEAAPPAAETTPSAYLPSDTSLLGGATLTADTIRGADDAALGEFVNSLRPRARSETQPLSDAETFAVGEQRRRFLAAGNEEAAAELEQTFRLPPREDYTPANGQPNTNGGSSSGTSTITPEEAGVTNGGEIPTR